MREALSTLERLEGAEEAQAATGSGAIVVEKGGTKRFEGLSALEADADVPPSNHAHARGAVVFLVFYEA
jgi:hypothetical protein